MVNSNLQSLTKIGSSTILTTLQQNGSDSIDISEYRYIYADIIIEQQHCGYVSSIIPTDLIKNGLTNRISLSFYSDENYRIFLQASVTCTESIATIQITDYVNNGYTNPKMRILGIK